MSDVDLLILDNLSTKSPRKRQVETVAVSLTRGQVNAVRAAFKAGIKPSVMRDSSAYPNPMFAKCWRPMPVPRAERDAWADELLSEDGFGTAIQSAGLAALVHGLIRFILREEDKDVAAPSDPKCHGPAAKQRTMDDAKPSWLTRVSASSGATSGKPASAQNVWPS